jgi:hypothetical protein
MADRKARTPARAAQVGDEMRALLRPVPAPEPEPEPARTEAAAPKPKPATRPRKTAHPPAQQKAEPLYGKRIPFMTDAEQYKALATARLEDGIEATTRLRAMVKLWTDNPQFRRQVDKVAAAERERDQRARYNK